MGVRPQSMVERMWTCQTDLDIAIEETERRYKQD